MGFLAAHFPHLALGFNVALSLQNLWYCFIGVLVGTLIGVLPGIGPSATIAMLLPMTFTLPPVPALIMLAGIYYGARNGRAGPALGIAAIGSFIAGTVSTLMIANFAPPLAEVALLFGPSEYFALMVVGLVAAVVLAQGSLIKAIGMVLLGLLLGLIGTDVNSGVERFTLHIEELADGI